MLNNLSVFLCFASLVTGQQIQEADDISGKGPVTQNFLFNWIINSGKGDGSPVEPNPNPEVALPICSTIGMPYECQCGLATCSAGQICDATISMCIDQSTRRPCVESNTVAIPNTVTCDCGVSVPPYPQVMCSVGQYCWTNPTPFCVQ